MFYRVVLFSTLLAGLAVGTLHTKAGAQPPRPVDPQPVEPLEFPTQTPTEPIATPEALAPFEADPDILGAEPAASTSAVAWQPFVSEAGSFQVAMPSEPAVYTFNPDANPAANITDSRLYMQMQLADAAHLEIYVAAFIDAAEFITDGESVERALRSCVDSLGGRIASATVQDLLLGEHPGIESEFQGADGKLQISRCYLVGDRAYLLAASREPFDAGADLRSLTEPAITVGRSPAMETFFNSFEILN